MKDIINEVIVVFITVILTMAGYWLMIGRDLTTRSEVSMMISDNNRVIDLKLSQLSDSSREFSLALKENTAAINELRLTIAKLAGEKN
jgi:hypothetical protein